MSLFRRSTRPPQAIAQTKEDRKVQVPPIVREVLHSVVPFPSDFPELSGKEMAWAAAHALLPFLPRTLGEQKTVEEGLVKASDVGQKYILPPLLCVAIVTTSTVPLRASDAPAWAQRFQENIMTNLPRNASEWVSAHSEQVAAAARAYKQYATGMRLYERLARSRDIGFTLSFEIPPVRLSNDLGGDGYDDVVIRPAGATDLMLERYNPKNFGVSFDFSALKSQLNGLLMGKWDIDYSRVTIGPDGKKTVDRNPAEIAALAKTTAVASWLLGDHKINPFGNYVDSGVDTRTRYDAVAKDLSHSWQRRMRLRDRVQARLLKNIQDLAARGADATGLQMELTNLLISRAIDEGITADSSAQTGNILGDEQIRRLKALDAEGLAAMEIMASNRFRLEMTGQNQQATSDAVGAAAQQYNNKADYASLASDVYDLTAQVAGDFGLSLTHQTLPGAGMAQAGAWVTMGKAIADATKAASPDSANREQIGNQMKSNAYLSGQEQHLAEILRTLNETGIDQQNQKVQAILAARTEKLANVTAEALEQDVEERSQDAVDIYSQGLDKRPRVFGIAIKMEGRKLFPENLDEIKTIGDVPIPADASDLNVVAEGDSSDPKDMEAATATAKDQVQAAYDKKLSEDLTKVPDALTKELQSVNWARLGFLDPVIEALNSALQTILGKSFNLGNQKQYDQMRGAETIDAGKV